MLIHFSIFQHKEVEKLVAGLDYAHACCVCGTGGVRELCIYFDTAHRSHLSDEV